MKALCTISMKCLLDTYNLDLSDRLFRSSGIERASILVGERTMLMFCRHRLSVYPSVFGITRRSISFDIYI